MMIPMNEKLYKVMSNTNDKEKIRLFYELGKYFLENVDDSSDGLETLFDDIANVVNDIENL